MKKVIFFTLLFLSQPLVAQKQANDSISKLLFSTIKVFPNPTSEILFIKNGDLIQKYTLINTQGQTVQKGINKTQIISLIDLPIGYYFLFIEIDGYTKRYRVQKY